MSTCFFDGDFSKKMRCEYVVKDGGIEVSAEYLITDEIEPINGVRIESTTTRYRTREILIVDSKGKINYLLKNAYYWGHSFSGGSPDSVSLTTFRSEEYLSCDDFAFLMNLPKTLKVSKFRVFSRDLIDVIGRKSLQQRINDEKLCIDLTRKAPTETISIGKRNIKRISLSDYWHCNDDYKEKRTTIEFDGCIEVNLIRNIYLEKLKDYVNELTIFLQLFMRNKLEIISVQAVIEGYYVDYNCRFFRLVHKSNWAEKSVNDTLLSFLKKAYSALPYRNNTTEDVRSLRYMVFSRQSNMEDNFLTYFRFVECYYKRTSHYTSNCQLLKDAIADCYRNDSRMDANRINDYSQEIVSLRNHYAHKGYYLPNCSLDIIGPRRVVVRTERHITYEWLEERTNVLRRIVIDIVFRKMLGYQIYKYEF